MMIKGWRRIPLGTLLALGLAAAGCSCGTPETTGQVAKFRPNLEEDPTGQADYYVDFGVVAIGDRSAKRVTVENGGNTALAISSGKLERPFSHDIPSGGLNVNVGATGTLVFAFEPVEETKEPLEIIVDLLTNADNGKKYTVRLEGHGKKASLECDPPALDFGPVAKNKTATLTTVCTNPLSIPVEVEASRFKGNYAQFFSAKLEGAVDGWVKVPAEGSVELSITFQSQSVGRNDAVLELNDAFNQSLASVSVVAESVSSSVYVDPSTCLDFSYVGVGETATKSFQVRSIGDRPIQITKIEVPEGNEGDFTVLTSTPIDLATDGSSQPIEVAFHPDSGGPHQTQILIYTNDPDAKVVTACAKGFGGGPAIACSREAIDFGMVAIGMPVRMSYTCMNSGVPVPGVPVDPLVIDGIRSTSPEFTASIVGGANRQGYKIGDLFDVEVLYSPTAERFDNGTIFIETKSAPGGEYGTTVSGQGRDLPPCEFEVTPSLLRFGIVDRGDELTQGFTIKNLLDTSCLINDLRLTADSDPAFSVEPIQSVELLGNSSLKVPVTFAPTSYKALFTGAVEFQISNPSNMNQRVDLRGTSAKPCISVEPKIVDFGKVGPGCQSREVWVAVSNICGTPVTVKSVSVGDSGDKDSFQIRRRPILPRTLHANEREELTMVFVPNEEGTHRASIEVEVEGSESYMAQLVGESEPNPIQTDTFDQKARPKVDILWVIDNSGSFSPYQDRISENLPSFLTTAKNNNVDYRIAVTTSGLTTSGSSCPGGANGGEDGRFFPINGSHPRVLTPTTPDLEAHWAHNVKVGTCHGTEQYIEAAFRALSKPLIDETKSSKHGSSFNDGNAGFLRREASLSIIFVADEVDQSTSFGKTLPEYLAFFKSLKGHNMLRIHAISGSRPNQPSSCNLRNGERFHDLIEATEGNWLDICTPKTDTVAWSEGLKKMSEGAFGFLARFVLRGIPADRNGDGKVNEDDIDLFVDGRKQEPVSPSRQQRWTYDPVDNAIDFTPLFIPKAGSQITATYKVACISQ